MNKLNALIITFSILLASTNAFSQESDSLAAWKKSTDTKVAKLESIINKLPKISGFINLRYQYSDEGDGKSSFDVRRARLDFRGDLAPKFDYRLQLEFAGTPKILDAYVRWKPFTYLSFQVGQMKLPLTFENLITSSLLETVENSMIVSGLTGSSDISGLANSGMDIGASAYGAFWKHGDRNIIEYQVGIYNGNGINKADNNKKKDFSGMLWIYPAKNLTLAAYHYNGAYRPTSNDEDITRVRSGAGIRYDNKKWLVRSEYLFGKTGGQKTEGMYALAGYTFPNKLQPMLKYDYCIFNKDNHKTTKENYVVGLNYHYKGVRAQVNYTYQNIWGAKNVNLVGVQLFGIF